MRCPKWPPQAAAWPRRPRNHGWPDSATVQRVVNGGCDVVPVAHYLYRDDEWVYKRQYRLSFSRAEIVLLNSWMSVQQIVYHMLRVFMKSEQLTDNDTGEGPLSNYHIKTLMLWACEQKPARWWTDELNIIEICVEMLHTFAFWLYGVRCKHYFISACNLFEHIANSFYTKVTAILLMSTTRASICKWYIDNYISKCVQFCPSRISNLLWDSRPHDGLHNATSLQKSVFVVAKCRLHTSSILHFFQLQAAKSYMIDFVSRHSLTLRSCLCWINQLAKTDHVLRLYFTAVVFLHVSYKTQQGLGLLTDEILHVSAATCLQSNDVRLCFYTRISSVLSLRQAAILMKVTANNSGSTVQLIETELSKA